MRLVNGSLQMLGFVKVVMSPWLFNLYMDGVVRKVQARKHRRGAQLLGEVRKNEKLAS